MKLIKSLLGFVFVFNLVWMGFAAAIAPSSNANTNTNSQYYSVIFDNEQEASVVAKLTYTNRSQDDITNLSLEIPGSSVRIISIIQEQYQVEKCLTYSNDTYYDNYPDAQRPCQEWAPRVTFASIVRDEGKDQKSDQSLKIDVPLKEAIKVNNSSGIIIYYKTKGFVTKSWNGYKYAFQTIKSPYDIDNVRVAINVTDDLYIKDTAKATTNYQENMVTSKSLDTVSFSASPSLEAMSTDITQTQQGVVKETTSLDPNENYKVEGKYYKSQFMGQLPAIAGVAFTFLIIVIVLILIIKNEKKNL